jgi:O-antigen/teichoic acid export membrane protein
LRGLRRGTSALVFGASAGISLCGAGIVRLLHAHLGTELELTFYAGFPLVPILTQLQLSGALHRGLKRAASAGAFYQVLRPLIVLVLLAILVIGLRRVLSAPIALIASTAGALIALGVSDWVLSAVWPAGSAQARPVHDLKAWTALGRQLFFIDIIGIVLSRVDVLILGAFTGAAEVGPYYAAVQIATVAVYGLNAVNAILAPMIAERYSAKDHAGLEKISRQAAWLMIAVTTVVMLAAVLLGRWALGLFGPAFVVAYGPLLILLAGQCCRTVAGPAGFMMTMTRLEKRATAVFGGGAVTNIALSLLLIPPLGTVGAALAAAAGALYWSVAAVILVRGKLRLNPTVLPWLDTVRS